jgi:hypothetical protein
MDNPQIKWTLCEIKTFNKLKSVGSVGHVLINNSETNFFLQDRKLPLFSGRTKLKFATG